MIAGFRAFAVAGGGALALFAACATPPQPPPHLPGDGRPLAASASSVQPPPPVAASELRILYTSDEHGWIAPFADKGRRHDGAAGLAARYAKEGLCTAGPCEESNLIALSGGDQWTGPAISSFFRGKPAAELWKLIGFSASALGNHELDFGRKDFYENQQIEGFPYLAANVTPTRENGGVAEPFALFKRGGITLGVVGLSTRFTPVHGMRANYEGLAFGEEEEALVKTVPEVWKRGADVVVVIAHVCGDALAPIVARHPEWKLSFVGAGHCHRVAQQMIGSTPVIEAGAFLRSYVRVTIPVDLRAPVAERAVGARFEMVDLTYPETDSPPLPLDPVIKTKVAAWQAKVDAALGQVVGHSNAALDPDTPMMVNLITDAWRDRTKADVAILNRHATRQPIPAGTITKQSVYSVMPFDNHLVLMHVTGEALLENLACCNGHVSGATRKAGKWQLTGGRPIDKKRVYAVVTTDYSYTGGSGFKWEKADPKAETTVDWRDPVLDWLTTHPTTKANGLESLLDKTERVEATRSKDKPADKTGQKPDPEASSPAEAPH